MGPAGANDDCDESIGKAEADQGNWELHNPCWGK